MKTNEELYKEALEAARRLFEDQRVSKDEAHTNLSSLVEEIEVWMESLRS